MLLRWPGELVSPSRCAACDERVDPRHLLLFCEICASTVERAPPGASSAFAYGGAIAEAIMRMKYGGRPDLASRLGAAMAACPSMERRRGTIDLVVPVPLHPLRLVDRGYNQAALLARPLARFLGVPLAARALERVRHTPRQAAHGRAKRLVNVSGAFRCRDAPLIGGARVLVVDDVRTTGATLAECTSTLALYGARAIVPFVLATRDDELHGIV
jgi:ComF family protein